MSVSEVLAAALRLIGDLDPKVLSAVYVSLSTAIAATILATLIGAPLGFLVANSQFRGKHMVELILNTSTALPTVVVGLLTYALLSRRGLLGDLGLLYTRSAIILGQTVLIIPLLTALSSAVLSGVDPRIRSTALTLGASRFSAALTVCIEARRGLFAAVAAAFGRLISELGIALMVGGNIAGVTRTMTTAIALETSKGELALGLALGILLLAVALAVNIVASLAGAGLAPRERAVA